MHKLLAALLLIALSACAGSLPQSAEETRKYSKSSALMSSKSATVSKSMTAVRSVLQRMSSQCYNRNKSNTSIYRAGPTGPQSVTFRFKYSSTVRTHGNTTTLAVRINQQGNLVNTLGVAPKDGYVGFVVDAVPSSGGTQITIYGASIEARYNMRSVVKSINTGRIQCLDLS